MTINGYTQINENITYQDYENYIYDIDRDKIERFGSQRNQMIVKIYNGGNRQYLVTYADIFTQKMIEGPYDGNQNNIVSFERFKVEELERRKRKENERLEEQKREKERIEEQKRIEREKEKQLDIDRRIDILGSTYNNTGVLEKILDVFKSGDSSYDSYLKFNFEKNEDFFKKTSKINEIENVGKYTVKFDGIKLIEFSLDCSHSNEKYESPHFYFDLIDVKSLQKSNVKFPDNWLSTKLKDSDFIEVSMSPLNYYRNNTEFDSESLMKLRNKLKWVDLITSNEGIMKLGLSNFVFSYVKNYSNEYMFYENTSLEYSIDDSNKKQTLVYLMIYPFGSNEVSKGEFKILISENKRKFYEIDFTGVGGRPYINLEFLKSIKKSNWKIIDEPKYIENRYFNEVGERVNGDEYRPSIKIKFTSDKSSPHYRKDFEKRLKEVNKYGLNIKEFMFCVFENVNIIGCRFESINDLNKFIESQKNNEVFEKDLQNLIVYYKNPN